MRARGRGRGRAADTGVPVPADRSSDRRGENGPRGEDQEGPIPRALGHEERRGQGALRRAMRMCSSPSAG